MVLVFAATRRASTAGRDSTPADVWPSMGTWDAKVMRAQFPHETFHFEVRCVCFASLLACWEWFP